MVPNWNWAEGALNQIQVLAQEDNAPVIVLGSAEGLRCIGIGTDAAVFRHQELPEYAFKVYTAEAEAKKTVEEQVYSKLDESPYFPKCYGAGKNYLVLSYEPGVTLYDCLLQGIHIPRQAIDDVEEARKYVRSVGLNPRDIHLKNILLQDGRAKLLDVSEYVKPGNDRRWEHLLWGYEQFYPLIDGVKVSSWVLDTVKNWYKKMDTATFAIEDFGKRISQLFVGNDR
ncbi:serine/threonine protein kinase [Effusibacillus consociatus]|uniref:Serine/threonine protein kinase n=1 Tax=Effusibacillus consociatus TaxID=1117041 RepID=A0ABV9Q0Q4_9BACL